MHTLFTAIAFLDFERSAGTEDIQAALLPDTKSLKLALIKLGHLKSARFAVCKILYYSISASIRQSMF